MSERCRYFSRDLIPYKKRKPGSKAISVLSTSKNNGFTLIEIIIGLALGASALALISTLILPLFTRSVEPILQIRAAEFAQAVLDDVLSKRYAENTPVGGQPVCSSCTAISVIDAGEATREHFDDVDDYNAFCTPQAIQDVFGFTLNNSDDYAGYTFSVCVGSDGNYDGTTGDGNDIARLITVTVNPPEPAIPVVVSAYRGNY